MENATVLSTIAPTAGANKSGLPGSGSNAVPVIVATVVIMVSVVLLIAGIKLCGRRRKSNSSRNVSTGKKFWSFCHKSVDVDESAIVPGPMRKTSHRGSKVGIQESEIHVNENTEASADEVPSTSTDEIMQHQTVEVEIHEDSISNDSIRPSATSLPTSCRTSTPQDPLPSPTHKPFRMIFATNDAIYDIA